MLQPLSYDPNIEMELKYRPLPKPAQPTKGPPGNQAHPSIAANYLEPRWCSLQPPRLRWPGTQLVQ
jgi:hypothetical protein